MFVTVGTERAIDTEKLRADKMPHGKLELREGAVHREPGTEDPFLLFAMSSKRQTSSDL
jgi:hypothetical protein